MVLYVSGLHNERFCVTQQSWWQNTAVPQRTDEVNPNFFRYSRITGFQVAFEDLTPYMIMTQTSIDELNSRLSQKVSKLETECMLTGGPNSIPSGDICGPLCCLR